MVELYKWQAEALEALRKANWKGIVVAVTGTGKTFVAVNVLTTLKQRTLVIVPTIALMNQWKEELLYNGVKLEDLGLYYGSEKIIKPVTIAVINSIYDQTNLEQHFSLVICDEIHRYGAETWQRFLLNNRFKYSVGLTATLKRQDGEERVLLERIGEVVYEYKTEDAVNDDLLNEFSIINVGIDLPDKERDYLARLDENIKTEMQRFNNDFGMVVSAIKKGNKYAAKTLKMVNTRRKFYNNSLPKIYKAAKLIQSYIQAYNTSVYTDLSNYTDNIEKKKYNKIIVFGEYIETIDILYKTLKDMNINTYVYYSGNKDSLFNFTNKEKEEIITSFVNDKNGILLTVKSLDEGLNVKDVNIGIILGYNKTDRQAIQRMGRILRKVEGKHPIMYNFYYRNTQDYWNAKNFADNFKEAGNVKWE